MDDCRVMRICARFVLALTIIAGAVALTAGCLVQPASTDPAAVAAYNNQLFSLIQPFVTPIVMILGVLALWLKSNWDKHELARTTKEAAEALAEASKARNERVLDEVRQQKEINVSALNAANNLNDKMLAVQETVAKHTARAPARATDKAALVVAVPPDQVQKMELVAGPGVETPLKVQSEDDIDKGAKT